MMAFASSSGIAAASAFSVSQPSSQTSSPASPTANFSSQQQQLNNKQPHTQPNIHSLRSGGSRPTTPVQNVVNLLNSGQPLDAPPGMSYIEFVRGWNDQHVARWLAEFKCVSLASTFKENDIRGDVILDLDQQTLKEMGIASIGDRIRILNAVKALRLKCHARMPPTPTVLNGSSPLSYGANPRVTLNGDSGSKSSSSETTISGRETTETSPSTRHRGRPAPLQLLHNQHHSDLPRLIRDSPSVPESSTRSGNRSGNISGGGNTSLSSGSAHSAGSASASRPGLPPLPPAPRSQPPLPPSSSTSRQPLRIHSLNNQSGRRTPTQADAPHYAQQPLPPAPQPGLLTPLTATPGSSASNTWKGEYGLPAGPRPGNVGGAQTPIRSTSPLPPPTTTRPSPIGPPTHGKNASLSSLSSIIATPKIPQRSGSVGIPGPHPYASSSSALQPPSSSLGQTNLSPIAESFISGVSSTTANMYSVGRFGRPSPPSVTTTPSLDDLRRKLIKFFLAESAASAIINVADCKSGEQVLVKALKKFGKLNSKGSDGDGFEHAESDDGGLVVEGWGVFLDWGDEPASKPLSESQLLKICHAGPDHPGRDKGLALRRVGKYTTKRSKVHQILGDSAPYISSLRPGSPSSPQFTSNNAQQSASEDEEGYLVVPPVGKNNNTSTNHNVYGLSAQDSKAMKRASSISVLSALGVPDPQKVLDPAPSPSTPQSSSHSIGPGSANNDSSHSSSAKSPSTLTFANKIQKFLGRPPSEYVSYHLQDYFPDTDKKVLRKTARQSMLRNFSNGLGGFGKRDSAASTIAGASGSSGSMPGSATKQLRSRFSSSTQASHSRTSISPVRKSWMSGAPSITDKSAAGSGDERKGSPGQPEEAVSVSPDETTPTDSAASDKPFMDSNGKPSHLLPPVNFPTERLSDSLNMVVGTGGRSGSSPSISRTTSNASKRMSYMSELRSRRDRSDTSSMLTVDEITAEVENRRRSMAFDTSSTTKLVGIGKSIGSMEGETLLVTPDEDDVAANRQSVALSIAPLESAGLDDEDEEDMDDDEEDEEDDMDDEEIEDEDEDTLADDIDEGPGKAVTSDGGKRAIKWIRGALIGQGSFGSVYLGMDAMNGLLMAVKQVELPTSSGPNEERKMNMLRALEHEIDLLKSLQHENIVQYLDSSNDGMNLNIFLEYVPGGSVTALLRNYGAFEEALVRHFVRQILRGLDYLHERDIIHRDIKGANILVDNKGGIKISDFGISKKVEESMGGGSRVHRPSLQGSVFWMAPEVVKQTSYTRKADIWSVGCLIVEMLTGQHPWAQLAQMQAIFKIGSGAKPTIPSDVSADCQDFLQRTFEINHEMRPTAAELLQHRWIVQDQSNANKPKAKGT